MYVNEGLSLYFCVSSMSMNSFTKLQRLIKGTFMYLFSFRLKKYLVLNPSLIEVIFEIESFVHLNDRNFLVYLLISNIFFATLYASEKSIAVQYS